MPKGTLLDIDEVRARGPQESRTGRRYVDDADIWLREHDPRYGRRGSTQPRARPVEPDLVVIAPELLYAEW